MCIERFLGWLFEVGIFDENLLHLACSKLILMEHSLKSRRVQVLVIRDSRGLIIGALSQRIRLPGSVDMVEALAARRAVVFA